MRSIKSKISVSQTIVNLIGNHKIQFVRTNNNNKKKHFDLLIVVFLSGTIKKKWLTASKLEKFRTIP